MWRAYTVDKRHMKWAKKVTVLAARRSWADVDRFFTVREA